MAAEVTHPPKVIIRRPKVEARTGHPRSTLYDRIRTGLFTRPISLGARACGWIEAEVEAINAARIAGKSDDEIRELVRQLEAERRAAT